MMGRKWKIHVRDGKSRWVDDDFADNEEGARQQASGWTGQRGQMAWKAIIYTPDGIQLATYKRGKEVKP